MEDQFLSPGNADLEPLDATQPSLAEELGISVPDWLIDHPDAFRLLEALGIDYSCGGKSLKSACLERGLDPRGTLMELKRFAAPP